MADSDATAVLDRERVDNLAKFVEWVEANGGRFNGCALKVCEREGEGLGVYTTGDQADPGALIIIPFPLAITPMTVLQDAALGPGFAKLFNEGDVDDRLVVQLFLLVESLRGDSSFWAPYLKILPTKFGTPMFFNNEDFEELNGTALYKATKIQRVNLLKHFQEKMKGFAEAILASVGWHEREVQFEDFLWANGLFWTRALSVPCPQSLISPTSMPNLTSSLEESEREAMDEGRVGSRETSADEEHGFSQRNHLGMQTNPSSAQGAVAGTHFESEAREASEARSEMEGSSHRPEDDRTISDAEETKGYKSEANVCVEGLVPGIDFCNHAKKGEAEASWEVDDRQGVASGVPYSIYLTKEGNGGLLANRQVRINYGDKTNEELLYLYGFVLDNNIDEYLMVHFPKEAFDRVDCPESKFSLLEAQSLSLHWLLSGSLLQDVQKDQDSSGSRTPGTSYSSVHNYSWSGHRKPPQHLDKQVFPEDLMAAMRVIAMTENEVESVVALLEELSDPTLERFPSSDDIRMAVWEVCGDAGALQLVQDLLSAKLLELVEGTGSEEMDKQLLEKDAKATLEVAKTEQAGRSDNGEEPNSSQDVMSTNKRACVIYRKGQKVLAKCFLREAERCLQLWITQAGD